MPQRAVLLFSDRCMVMTGTAAARSAGVKTIAPMVTWVAKGIAASARSEAIRLAGLNRQLGSRSWSVLTVFAGIIGLQLLVTVISIDLMSAMRAYLEPTTAEFNQLLLEFLLAVRP